MKTVTELAQQIADQELEACLKALDAVWDDPANSTVEELQRAIRAARRPKPPTLKKQALEQLREVNAMLQLQTIGVETSAIRRALEELPDN